MVSIFRKYQKASMVLFAIISCFALIGFFNGPTSCSRNRLPVESDVIGKIYGNPVTKSVFSREMRKGQLAAELRLDLARIAGRANSENEALYNFAWNSFILGHEADQLQLEPTKEASHTDQSVLEAIKHVSVFETEDGQFDPNLYTAFINDQLPSLGFTADDLEEVVAEDLRMKKIMDLLHTTFVIPPSDYRAWYTARFQKLDVSVVHFNIADFAAKIQVSDDDIKKAFEQNLNGYTSDEKRGIKFVAFSLTDEEKKLEGKERIAALTKLSASVNKFMEALQENGAKFDDVAAEAKLPVTEVPPFTKTTPDPKIPQTPAFLEKVFQLTTENPVSEPVQDREIGTYYVVQLQEIVPSKRLTLAEARPQVIEQLKNSRALEQLTAQAHDVRNKILADIAAGKSFADAAKAEGQKVEIYPPFSPADPEGLVKKDDGSEVLSTALDMKEGDLSDFVPVQAVGGILIYLDKREAIDPEKYKADSVLYGPDYDKQQVFVVFAEWLRKQHAAANIIFGSGANNGTPVPPPAR